MKVWVTKYALTEGIQEMDAEPSAVAEGMITVRNGNWPQYFHGEGRDWHQNMAAAKLRAEAMRKAKIASIRKQIKRLEALSF